MKIRCRMVTRQVCKPQEMRAQKCICQRYEWRGIFYREELLPLHSTASPKLLSHFPHLFSATMPNPFSTQSSPLSRIGHVLVPSFCFQTLFPLLCTWKPPCRTLGFVYRARKPCTSPSLHHHGEHWSRTSVPHVGGTSLQMGKEV